MTDEGYIKFVCAWTKAPLAYPTEISELNRSREVMYQKGLIGVYPDGISFGNISLRLSGNQFLISGTETGSLLQLNDAHYAKIVSYDFKANTIECIGMTKASSESLTHAAFYQANSRIGSVIHYHHLGDWERLNKVVPTTAENISYGTPEMAEEILSLFTSGQLTDEGLVVMGGHKEGLICFATSLQRAADIVIGNHQHLFPLEGR